VHTESADNIAIDEFRIGPWVVGKLPARRAGKLRELPATLDETRGFGWPGRVIVNFRAFLTDLNAILGHFKAPAVASLMAGPGVRSARYMTRFRCLEGDCEDTCCQG